LLAVLGQGGQEAVDAIEAIKGDALTQKEIEAAYRAQIDPLKNLYGSLKDLSVGSVVAKN